MKFVTTILRFNSKMAMKTEKVWKIFSDQQDSMMNFGSYGILILNGPINLPPERMISLWLNATWRMTVDGGTNRWFDYIAKHGISVPFPQYVTGDFDSIRPELLQFCKEQKEIVVEHTPNQDFTDFDKALFVLQKNCPVKLDCFIAVVENSDRLDHTFSNLNTVYKSALQGYLLADSSITWFLHPGSHKIYIPEQLRNQDQVCGLLPLSSPAKVTTKGLKWNLDNQTIEFGRLISSSNTFDGNPEVLISTDPAIIWTMSYK